jgi:V8-like Glu-specific endopeptidase
MRNGFSGVLAAVLCIGMIGCLSIEGESEIGTVEQAIINGTPTNERPEVGIITNSGCTATLIRPRVILTAAHCVNYQSGPRSDGFLTGNGEFFAVDYAASRISSGLGWGDLAVARLTSAVPPSSAVPTPNSYGDAGSGETVTVYGYGCTDRASGVGYGTKRKYTFPYYMRYQLNLLCPGDSGGPMIFSRGVNQVNSGYYLDGSGDIYASVADNYSWVSSWADYLNQ